MTQRPRPRPTDAELALLRVLWALGPSTVRTVHERVTRDRATGYTTTLKLLQIMTDKKLVRRDESGRTHVYEARVSQDETGRQLVNDLVERAFGGSAATMVMHVLSSRPATLEELDDIRRMLNEHGARLQQLAKEGGDQ